MTRADTAQRGLEHWSEAGRAEMEAFYSLAVEDYRQLVQAADWPGLLGSHAHDDWRLLDVACGSGKFPAALLRDADLSTLPPLPVDLLDPSAFSVAEAKGVLALPFVAGRELVVTLQDLPADLPPYDVVWATHALYALPVDELPAAAERFMSALAPGGLGVVAQATSTSHYLAFYDAFGPAVVRPRPRPAHTRRRPRLRQGRNDVRRGGRAPVRRRGGAGRGRAVRRR